MTDRLAWTLGSAVGVAVGAGAYAWLVADPVLAGALGVVWGVVAWTYRTHREAAAVEFGRLDGGDRWLAVFALLVAGALFAAVGRLPLPPGTDTLAYLLAVGVVLSLPALVVAVADANRDREPGPGP